MQKSELDALVDRIASKKLTYLKKNSLLNLAREIERVDAQGLAGNFIEAGCALGGSTILIARCKARSRPLLVYDVFAMIPPPGEKDTKDVHARYRVIAEGKSAGIGGEVYYGYRENLYETVVSNLQEFGIDRASDHVTLVKGLLQDTLEVSEPVAFAHIDVDWYDPVTTCLDRIFPRLVTGGCIVLDDYFAWGGCRKAVDTFLSKHGRYCSTDDSAGVMKITRVVEN